MERHSHMHELCTLTKKNYSRHSSWKRVTKTNTSGNIFILPVKMLRMKIRTPTAPIQTGLGQSVYKQICNVIKKPESYSYTLLILVTGMHPK